MRTQAPAPGRTSRTLRNLYAAHICAGTGHSPATSALPTGSHLRRDRGHAWFTALAFGGEPALRHESCSKRHGHLDSGAPPSRRRAVPAQMWAGASPVPAQMWAGVSPAQFGADMTVRISQIRVPTARIRVPRTRIRVLISRIRVLITATGLALGALQGLLLLEEALVAPIAQSHAATPFGHCDYSQEFEAVHRTRGPGGGGGNRR